MRVRVEFQHEVPLMNISPTRQDNGAGALTMASIALKVAEASSSMQQSTVAAGIIGSKAPGTGGVARWQQSVA